MATKREITLNEEPQPRNIQRADIAPTDGFALVVDGRCAGESLGVDHTRGDESREGRTATQTHVHRQRAGHQQTGSEYHLGHASPFILVRSKVYVGRRPVDSPPPH